MAKPKRRHPKHAASIKRNIVNQQLVDAIRACLGKDPLYAVRPKAAKKAKRESGEKS